MAADSDVDDDLSRVVLDNLLEGCQLISPDFRYLYVNDAVVKQGKRSREALIGKTMSECYPGIEDTEMFAILRRCMDDQSAAAMENEFRFADGSSGWFELRFEPVPGGVAVLSVDITGRKRAELMLERTLRALTTLSRCNQTLVRAVDEDVFTRDVAGLVVDAGYRGALIFFTDGEVLRRAVVTGVTAEAVEQLDAAIDLDKLSREVLATKRPVARSLAEPIDGVVAALALPVVAGSEALGVLAILAAERLAFDGDERGLLDEVAMDLGYGIEILRGRGERHRIEERLAASNRLEAVGRLAGGVAHDFNNLLSVILSYSALAAEQIADPEVRADIEQIHDAGVRAAALTRQLLAFSRRQVLEPRVTQLSEVLDGVIDLLRRLLGENIAIEVAADPELGNVLADPGQLEQVIVNLAINARDAMPDGGVLEIALDNAELDAHEELEPGRYVRITVRDNGAGMSEEVRSRVFEPFFTTKSPGEGTGLGMSMVYGIIAQSGGAIAVDSAPEAGTAFVIHLPQVDRSVTPSPAPRRRQVSTGDELILIVEDERAVRNAAARILRSAGYRILTAATGAEAVVLAESHGDSIDLLLTDVIMPHMSGAELAKQIAEHNPSIQVLFTSGFTDNTIERHGVLEPGIHFLAKPFTIDDMTHKVRAVLGS
jgi:PAS domain S-box-containing protein